MAVAEKLSGGVSRRALLTGGLAGGFLLAFHLPVRAVNEPVQPPDTTTGKFAPNAFIRIDPTGQTTLVMPQVEMGQGVYTSIADDPGRGTRRRFHEGDAGARAAERQAVRQSRVRPPGHRQFQFGPGVLEAAARGRRQRARHAGAGRRRSNGRSNRQAARHRMARSCTPQAAASSVMANWRWRRAARRRQRTSRSRIPKNFVLIGKPLKRLDTPDKVNGKAVYGIDAMLARHEVRDGGGMPGVRRQGRARSTTAPRGRSRACGRSSCSTIWSPWSAITCGRRRKVSMRW